MKNSNKRRIFRSTLRAGWVCLFMGLGMMSFAQKINVSQQLDEAGRSRSTFLEWTRIGNDPLSLVVQYQAADLIEEPKMYLFIDKKTELHEFVEFDTYKIEVPDSAKSIYKRVAFKELGDYIISFTNADKEIVLSDTLKIRGRNKVFFCRGFNGSKPFDIRDDYYATSTGLYYYKVVIQGEDNFATHQFKMNIYQFDGVGFNTLIGKYKQYTSPTRRRLYFGGPFLDPGKYKVEVFKHNGEPFAEAFLNLMPYKKADDDPK